tara:strand:+ start:32957 stop:33919 length:963 start_codon:yes stop_codon:yes gene_type:complete
MKSKNRRSIPFRDIEADGITYSFLDEWLLDREQARLSYVEGWASEGGSDALNFGLVFHDCLEWIAAGKSVRSIRRWIINPYLDKKSHKLLPEDYDNLEVLMEIVKVVFTEYVKFWGDYDADFDYLYQEESFKVEHETSSGHVVPLRGRWDAVYRDTTTGKMWLMENKTKSRVDQEAILASLPFDLQTMLYVHALQEREQEPVAGILYNVIRRPLLRQRKNESVAEYLWRVEDDVVTRPEHYFMRWKIDLLEDDIVNWVSRSLNPILDQVALWWRSIKDNPFEPWDSPLHYSNPQALFTKYGKSRYFNLITRGSTEGLYQR